MTHTTTDKFLNPLEPGFFDDPYPQYAMLREQAPVHISPLGAAIVMRHEHVTQVLTDRENIRSDDTHVENNSRRELLLQSSVPFTPELSVARLEPPDHTRIRNLVRKAFTIKRVNLMRPFIENLVEELLTPIAQKPTFDVLTDYSFDLPFRVVCAMVGIPGEAHAELMAYSRDIAKTLDIHITIEDVRLAEAAGINVIEYLTELIEEKRRNPGNDLLSDLIAVEEAGDRLTVEEIIPQVSLLFIAGHETTANLIGNGLYTLLKHPEQAARVRDGSANMRTCVEELLRFESPVQAIGRCTSEQPYLLGGVEIPPHTMIMLVNGSANRDPRQWGPDADVLDIDRQGAGQHLTFAEGIHFCLGAGLARLEATIAIPAMLRRFPDLSLIDDDPPQWRPDLFLRGLARFPLATEA